MSISGEVTPVLQDPSLCHRSPKGALSSWLPGGRAGHHHLPPSRPTGTPYPGAGKQYSILQHPWWDSFFRVIQLVMYLNRPQVRTWRPSTHALAWGKEAVLPQEQCRVQVSHYRKVFVIIGYSCSHFVIIVIIILIISHY